MREVIPATVSRPLAWSVLGALWLLVLALGQARAQTPVQHVVTRDGIEFALTRDFHESVGAGQSASTLERAYGGAGSPPLQLFVLHDEAQPSLPEASARLTQGYAEGFARTIAAALGRGVVYDVRPGRYDPQRGAFSLSFKTRTASRARQALDVPPEHPLWDPARRAGNDPKQIRCLVRALLGNMDAADAVQLRSRYPTAAHSCGWSEQRVERYVSDAGLAVFAPAETAFASLAVFTRTGTTQLLAVAPVERQAALPSLTELLWKSLRVPPRARLGTDPWDELRGLTAAGTGELLGTALGSGVALLLAAAALAWLFGRLGANVKLGVYFACALLLLWTGLGVSRVDGIPLQAMVQLASYVLAAALALRPLTRSISRHTQGRAR